MQMRRFVAIALTNALMLQAHTADMAFVNVNVVPMTSEIVVEAQTVLVEDRKIVTIGDVDVIPIAKGTVVVDDTRGICACISDDRQSKPFR